MRKVESIRAVYSSMPVDADRGTLALINDLIEQGYEMQGGATMADRFAIAVFFTMVKWSKE
jgi:hypothetical protein